MVHLLHDSTGHLVTIMSMMLSLISLFPNLAPSKNLNNHSDVWLQMK
jgi:hypothetical protein